MKNIRPLATQALRLRYLRLRPGAVGEALASFAPMGWCGGVAQGEGEAIFYYGGSAIRDEASVTRNTIFRVASISKVFGAAAALLLVREGKLTLDVPVAPVLGFSTGRDITLRQLLTHTAGLDDRPLYDRAVGASEPPPLEKVLQGSATACAPGTRFHYSNLGAGVVGMLVEAASGMLFDDYVRACFFAPQGIDASFHPQRIRNKGCMANDYRIPGGALAYDAQAIAAQPLDGQPAPSLHYSVPAGKLMISAPDLLASLRRLPAMLPEMFVRQAHVGSVRCDAGRGLGVAWMPPGVIARDRGFWGHQGVAYGALCEAWLDPATGEVAVLLTNGIRLAKISPLYLAGQSGMAALLDLLPADGVY